MTIEIYNEQIGRRDFLAKAAGGLAALLGYNFLYADEYKPKERTSLSPNYTPNEGKRTIEKIILHTTEGTGKSAENTFLNPASKVSAHYLIMEDGEVVKMVDEKNIAWHCRNHNTTSVGIEIAGYHNRKINDTQIKSSVYLIKRVKNEYKLKDSNIKAHSELDPERRKDPGKDNIDAILKALSEGK